MRLRNLIPLLLLPMAAAACSGSSPSGGNTNENGQPPGADSYEAEVAFPHLSFSNPLDLQHPGDGSGRLFVVEQGGRIKVFANDASATEAATFLDITDQVVSGGERGLLGLAFHPGYEANGYFYVNYTAPDPLRTVISRFRVSADDPNRADAASESILLSFPQPFGNHNGGQVRFGPDGYLYIATGDGGSGGDPQGNGQDRSTLLGAILRIDVSGTAAGNNYAIPPDNPFAGNDQGFREEIFAYGLRNPFRFSFDAETGRLWAGDVGQNEFEEIDIIENGHNYGWNIMEGNACYEASECDRSGLTPPVYVYDHSSGDRSVTGGFVYRGSRLQKLAGYYIYGDFVSGRIWALEASESEDPDNIELVDSGLNISSFGIDAGNELYFTAFDGRVYRLVMEE